MKILSGDRPFEAPKNAVVTIGTFDGVHFGHKKILTKLIRQKEKLGGESVVITFWPHPRFILKNKRSFKLLTTFDEKAELMADLGIDYLIKIPFTEQLSTMTPDDFVQKILVEQVNTQHLIIGYDHRFGKNREGGFGFLKANESRFGFAVEEIPKQEIDDVAVSSTKIRKALADADVSTATTYLGRPFSIEGKVVHGEKLGRKLGYPTANIQIPEEYKLIPADGVYVTLVTLEGEKFPSMLSVGFRPTVNGNSRTIEVHILDFDRDIYGSTLKVEFIDHLRPELKLDSLEELQEVMDQDKKDTLEIFRNLKQMQ